MRVCLIVEVGVFAILQTREGLYGRPESLDTWPVRVFAATVA